jgi:hypothetical protein
MIAIAKKNRAILKKCLKHWEIFTQTNSILIFGTVKNLQKSYLACLNGILLTN